MAAIAAFAIATLIFENQIRGDKTQNVWIFWLQTASGNWSPIPRPDWITNRTLAASAVAAVLINNGLYIAAAAIIWKFAKDRRQRMTFREALDAFEVAARAEIIRRMAQSPPGNLEETAARVDEGLAEGRRAALPLIMAVGGREAVAGWETAQGRTLGG